MLGYDDGAIEEIIDYAVGHGTLRDAPGVNHEALLEKGFTEEQIQTVEESAGHAFDIKFVFNKWTFGEKFCTEVLRLRCGSAQRCSPSTC